MKRHKEIVEISKVPPRFAKNVNCKMDSRYKKCRLCLKLGDFCSIFDQDDSIKLSDMVMSFTAIQIHEGDGLPDRVCTTCIENLSTAYLFKLQCERIDTLLRKGPESQNDTSNDYNTFFDKEFFIHRDSTADDNEQNSFLNSCIEEENSFQTENGEDLTSFRTAKSEDQTSFRTAKNEVHNSVRSSNNGDENSFRTACNEFISSEQISFRSARSGEENSFRSAYEDENSFKTACNDFIYSEQNSFRTGHEISDETDSDIDSIKCVYCGQGHSNARAHTCNVTCTIEHNRMQQSSSSETLVATEMTPPKQPPKDSTIYSDKFLTPPNRPMANSPNSDRSKSSVNVSCVLCDEKYDQYEDYVFHVNRCTLNVKLHHYVCPVCHEIYTNKLEYFQHLRNIHFRLNESDHFTDPGVDCVDFAPILEKTRRPKVVRRQIGWSIEDIYQEIDCKKIEPDPYEKRTPNSSPIKNFFTKLGNESFSRQSTPKKVSFRKWIETSKAKTSNYLPFKKYIQNYKLKKTLTDYSPIKDKLQVTNKIRLSLPDTVSDSDYHSPSGTSEESWKLKQNLICACDKKVFMLSESIQNRDRIVSMVSELGGVVAENTKMEMLSTHFVSVLPDDTFTGMMVCALATGKWLLHVSFIYDSFRCKKFLREDMYEWLKHPRIVEIDTTSVDVAKAAVFWHLELQALNAKYPFEGKQVILIMKKKYRQYYQMIFKTLKAKPITYDPRTPGSCCNADYCFVDMKVIERVKLRFFARHNVPVFPYQYILIYLLKRGNVADERKYLLQDCQILSRDTVYYMNKSHTTNSS